MKKNGGDQMDTLKILVVDLHLAAVILQEQKNVLSRLHTDFLHRDSERK